jgi:hypothetical protein
MISHLIFTRRTRPAYSNSKLERRVMTRLIVPTHMVKLMGRLVHDTRSAGGVTQGADWNFTPNR